MNPKPIGMMSAAIRMGMNPTLCAGSKPESTKERAAAVCTVQMATDTNEVPVVTHIRAFSGIRSIPMLSDR